MKGHDQKHYSFDPHVGIGDYRLLPRTTWEDIDWKASEVLGRECLGIPSVRVGMCWTLEFLGCRRHSDDVLVPKFMGRCILNALNRYAFPVEAVTAQTRLVIPVHQFGLGQRLEAIEHECGSRGIPYVEDSPYGLRFNEDLGPGSMAKFLGLTKILPVIKGALVITEDRSLTEFFKQKRRESSLWSWPVFAAMSLVRRKRKVAGYSALADAAYEMYVACKGDNAWLRGNTWQALSGLNAFAEMSGRRLSIITDRIGDRVLEPDAGRVPYVLPYFPAADVELVQEVFKLNSFDPNLYHIDVSRNLFSPNYEKALLIPTNPRIPFAHFETLIDGLASLESSRPSKTAPFGIHVPNG